MDGTVHDLRTGKPIGTTSDIDAVFLAAVRTAAAREKVYVVVGSDAPDGLSAAIADLGVPVVLDPDADGSALILSGDPDEWAASGGAA